MTDELKPCPMCGKSVACITTSTEMFPEIEDYGDADSYAVMCDAHKPRGPGGCGASGGFAPTEAEAIAAWNLRAQPEAQSITGVGTEKPRDIFPTSYSPEIASQADGFLAAQPAAPAQTLLEKLDYAMSPEGVRKTWESPMSGFQGSKRPDAAPSVAPEPVLWQWLDTSCTRKKMPKNGEPCAWRPLFAHPPRAPLTDAEIWEMAVQEEFLLVCDDIESLTEIVRAIEARIGTGRAG